MRSLLISYILFFACNLHSQDITFDPVHIYGPDQELYNGKKYAYAPLPSTGGHQFLFSPEYEIGGLTIKGKSFTSLLLNYDIFTQQLLLRYSGPGGAMNTIEVSTAWLECFSIGTRYFEYHNFGDGLRFYQVLGKGPVRILYYRDKKLEVNSGSIGYVFSETKKVSYVYTDGSLKAFKNKRSFIAIFSQNRKKEISSYLRKNRIKVKRATDHQMVELSNFIGNL